MQVLVPGVGGRGQEALLAQAVRVEGPHDFSATAAAYLEAGGSRVSTAAQGGFLSERTAGPSLAAEAGLVCVAPNSAEGARPLVAIGHGAGALRILCASHAACPACVDATLAALVAPASTTALSTHGALAAVAFQRLVLGLTSAPLECFALDADGALTPIAAARCSKHSESR